MSRARGKHTERHIPPQVTDDEDPKARDVGASTRTQGVPSPIPGGRPHLSNAATMRQQVPVPDSKPEVRGTNAHGVLPGTHTTRERAEFMRGPNDLRPLVPHYRHPDVPEPVVPVRIVAQAPQSIRTATAHHITVQASTGEATRLCGVDPNRIEVRLLNESQSSDVRFSYQPGDLVGGGGGLLPWPANAYTPVPTQDELWAISADSGTPTVSIMQIFDRPY
jgi:hypothetical protein